MPIPVGPYTASTTTGQQWIEEVREHLDGDRSEEANQLNVSYTAASGTMTLKNAMGNVAAGAYLSVGTNTLRVMSVTGQVATVLGGQQGTSDQDAAANALVRVNPRFTDHRILRAINRHLGALSSPTTGLYQVATQDIAYSSAVEGYELDEPNLLRVLEVRRDVTGVSQSWVRVPPGQWELQRFTDTTDFPSGAALRVTNFDGPCFESVHVVYAAPFTQVDDVTALVALTGISGTAEDIPPLGAALRLMAGREVTRNAARAQGDSRRATEVPPGAVAASYRGLLQLWSQRVQDEAARLRSQFPVRR